MRLSPLPLPWRRRPLPLSTGWPVRISLRCSSWCCSMALESVRAGRTRLAGVPYLTIILPAATILWTNLHGGFVAGLVMIGAYGCGELLQYALSPDRQAGLAARTRAVGYFACAFACLAASLVNPYTYHLHQHVI